MLSLYGPDTSPLYWAGFKLHGDGSGTWERGHSQQPQLTKDQRTAILNATADTVEKKHCDPKVDRARLAANVGPKFR